jgi:hypothetical protein
VSTIIIERLVAEQDSLGYWKDLQILSQLFSLAIEKEVKQQTNPLAAAAYLIGKWIEKNHPQKQYSLIVKKALGYARKEAANFQDYSALFDKYVK